MEYTLVLEEKVEGEISTRNVKAKSELLAEDDLLILKLGNITEYYRVRQIEKVLTLGPDESFSCTDNLIYAGKIERLKS